MDDFKYTRGTGGNTGHPPRWCRGFGCVSRRFRGTSAKRGWRLPGLLNEGSGGGIVQSNRVPRKAEFIKMPLSRGSKTKDRSQCRTCPRSSRREDLSNCLVALPPGIVVWYSWWHSGRKGSRLVLHHFTVTCNSPHRQFPSMHPDMSGHRLTQGHNRIPYSGSDFAKSVLPSKNPSTRSEGDRSLQNTMGSFET